MYKVTSNPLGTHLAILKAEMKRVWNRFPVAGLGELFYGYTGD